jgi:acyl dehydratase
MALDPNAVGRQTEPTTVQYDWRSMATYALGIGATREELAYLYERHPGGMKTFPTYAVVPAFEHALELIRAAGADFAMIVHGGQKIRAHRPFAPGGELSTSATLTGVYDLKRFAQLLLTTESRMDGELIAETQWSIIVRDAGGFGGPRPPADPAPRPPKDREPDWVVEAATSPEQALLYRISGDTNPLHADPAFAAKVGFEQGPILHGLCTYGFVARAVIARSADGDADALRALSAQFRKPVWPGDTIVTQGWNLGDGKVALVAHAKGRPDPVVTGSVAEIA